MVLAVSLLHLESRQVLLGKGCWGDQARVA